MSATTSATTGRRYGLERVCRTWERSALGALRAAGSCAAPRAVAEHRPPRDGRGRHDVPDAAGRGVGHSDADAGRAGAVRLIPQEEDVERRMDPSARSGCAGLSRGTQ